MPEIENLNISERQEFDLGVEWPPEVQAILPKTIFYDLANDYLDYPDIEQRFQAKKGFFSRFFG